MAEARFDSRLSALMVAVREMQSPQQVYNEKAGIRFERVDGVVSLYRLEDIVRVNRNPGTLGTGGRGGSFGNDMPLIPLEIDGEEHAKWRRHQVEYDNIAVRSAHRLPLEFPTPSA